MKRILIIGDSLSLQNEREKLSKNDTYSGKIINKYNNDSVTLLAEMGNDTRQAIKSAEHHINKIKPNCAIIQLGIVDSAPRVFSRHELDLIMRLPHMFQDILQNIARKHRYNITKLRKICYVPADEFESNYKQIVEWLSIYTKKIILVNIVHASNNICNISYDMRKNIKKYNDVILKIARKNNCSLIDLNDLTRSNQSLLAKDGYHLSKKGCNELFKQSCNSI